MSTEPIIYQSVGNNGISMIFPEKIEKTQLISIVNMRASMLKNKSEVILDSIITYNSLTIYYDNIKTSFWTLKQMLESVYLSEMDYKNILRRRWYIPVCYEDQFSLDLTTVARKVGMTEDAIVTLHSKTIYDVFFIGFLPGFLYLGGLDKRLHLSRLSTPRTEVQKGAVGIGGQQTGVYPNDSPGGWHIIGSSPINFFNPYVDPPCFAEPLDQIQFVPIDSSEYRAIEEKIVQSSYSLKSDIVYV